ncbi:MAG: EAL domain-containing protein, partial [Janthinobacterium sp.]
MLAKDVKNTFAIINELHKIGVTISIDDFGTGYSSLSYLKQFPIDVLKIDQSFTREILTEKSSAAIVAAIINMAHGLDLRLVAEGVETQAQAELLQQMGCTVMQGYLYSRPAPPERIAALLAAVAALVIARRRKDAPPAPESVAPEFEPEPPAAPPAGLRWLASQVRVVGGKESVWRVRSLAVLYSHRRSVPRH